ncbi:MAG: M67 family metallopeptidase [Phycisphaerales bacterium]|nr:MAG: M67 family metallopeptidase [Phycisphaerales bacterium]
MLKLEIPTDIFRQMVKQVRTQAPVEACGILAGADGTVEKLYEMTNADRSSRHFMMEPREQFAAVKDMRAAGLKMLAIYHSHPETPAKPSAEDVRLALTPDVVHVIISLRNADAPAVKGFLIRNGTITAVPVDILKT